jgi:hypothetical protein
MAGSRRSREQFELYTAEQLTIALDFGLQADTPAHVAHMACVEPQELVLNHTVCS